MNIWTKLGVSVAILGLFCIGCAELLGKSAALERSRNQIGIVVLGLGAAVFAVGRVFQRPLPKTASVSDEHQNPEEEGSLSQPERFMLLSLPYWGLMFATFGVIFIFIPPNKKEPTVVHATVKPSRTGPPLVTNSVAQVITPEAAPSPVEFPPLKLQGVVFKKENPSVVINNHTYFLGESIGEAKVIFIGETCAVLEIRGVRKTFCLSD